LNEITKIDTGAAIVGAVFCHLGKDVIERVRGRQIAGIGGCVE
jgi:hypothetical protein